MPLNIETVDPDWAWKAYVPDDAQPWSRGRAAHLFRRAGFGGSEPDLTRAVADGPRGTVDRLVHPSPASAAETADAKSLGESALAGGNAKSLEAWWLYRMRNASDVLLEKMTLFWHGHFATSADKVTDARLMFEQNELLRRHALGKFGPFVQEISRDPAMLIYLDSATNRKQHPNENYAREVMELFCLGEGEYSETDIRELARCFTGWEIKRGKFKFNKYQHDEGEKTVLGARKIREGGEGVEVVLSQPACPEFLVRKLLRFFVFDDVVPSDALIQPLVEEFRASDLDVRTLLGRVFASNLFFSPLALSRKVRSPVELGVGLLRGLEATTNLQALAEGTARVGQELFYPPNVKGWDGGRTWINSSTLLGRANLVRQIVHNDKTRFARGTLEELVGGWKLKSSAEIVARWCDLLLAREVAAETLRPVVSRIEESGGTREHRLREALCLLCTLPEFQLA